MADRAYFGTLTGRPLREIAEDIADTLRYGPKAGRSRVVCVDHRSRVWLLARSEAPLGEMIGAYVAHGDDAPVKQWLRVVNAIEEDLRHEASTRAAA